MPTLQDYETIGDFLQACSGEPAKPDMGLALAQCLEKSAALLVLIEEKQEAEKRAAAAAYKAQLKAIAEEVTANTVGLREALDAYRMQKEASTASLLRYVTKLNKAGKVPWKLTDRLAKKTQATAGRQAERFHRDIPMRQRGDVDTGQWLRTTGKTPVMF